MKFSLLFSLVLIKILILDSSSALDFVFNGFNPSNLLFYRDATIESHVLTLTNDSTFSIGRALYPHKIPTKSQNSSSHLLPFSTSFIFSISPLENFEPGHGLVFIFAPSTGIHGTSSSQHLGLFNRTNDGDPRNHVLGIEFDVFKNPEFSDIDGNHVGIDVNSLTSFASQSAGYWVDVDEKEEEDEDDAFEEIILPNGENYQVWIDYLNPQLNVTMAPAGAKRPKRPLLNVSIDLSEVFLDEMYVGFTAATGQMVENHRILAWCFSNSNFSISKALITSNLPSFVTPRKNHISKSNWFISGIVVGGIFVIACVTVVYLVLFARRRRELREDEAMEDWEVDYWPHRIPYHEIYAATNAFSEDNVIGCGGNGKVYRGSMTGEGEVAVKCISQRSNESIKEFLAEISSLGRLKHRNLVALKGWCKKDRKSLILVYDYMENGSLDERIFKCDEDISMIMNWEDRIRVLKDVASGVLYLHEGWESRVLHRDIKASNVLLDKNMNAKLGDFGLARMHEHGKIANTTLVVGTAGYLAPEVVQTGRASARTDVFSYGVLVLEVVSGRRPIENGRPALVEWIWGIMNHSELVNALDERLKIEDDVRHEEVKKVLCLGLLCAHHDPNSRPTMRQVVRILEVIMNGEKNLNGDEGMKDLFENLRPAAMWSKGDFESSHHRRKHPTFDELQLLLHSSMSISDSELIKIGR